MATMDAATQTDYLKELASNIWFVLGAYFFAFFPWGIMNNIDVISEKWRTCRRTRNLAHIHIASSIIPILYVAAYAEAQRRDGDNKELGAALAALAFNLFQLLRTVMGLLQLNAFLAWCNHAMECIRALQGDILYDYVSSVRTEGTRREERRRMMEIVRQWQNMFVSWRNIGLYRMRTLLRRDGENGEQGRNVDEDGSELSVNANVDGTVVGYADEIVGALLGGNGENSYVNTNADSNAEVNGQSVECIIESNERGNESTTRSNEQRSAPSTITRMEMPQTNAIVSLRKRVSECTSRRKADDGSDIEDVLMVNNMVVDNEFGGTEVTVLPSWKKVWTGMKNGRFTPSKWLRTDRVILSTVRWSGAYLCGLGAEWSAHGLEIPFDLRNGAEILQSFLSKEMEDVRDILQHVEWDMNVGNDGHDFLSIHRLGGDGRVELTGEMTTAYGNRATSYDTSDTSTVEAYSFEFNSLVSSYPASDEKHRSANRERIAVGLVHSVLLANHLGVETLHEIRRYYDAHHLPEGIILRKAFKLLLMQTNTQIADDAKIWDMFKPIGYQIPIFPYRMQMVALWDEATNWRVLQASAHHDNDISSRYAVLLEFESENDQRILQNAPDLVNIFDYCANWTAEQIEQGFVRWKGSLGVVMETVRTFLAEWITANPREPNWEPEIPTECIEFNAGETPVGCDNLTWICQRELQRKVAKMTSEDENFPGNSSLILLFILSFPLLRMDHVREGEADLQDCHDGVQKATASSSPSSHRSIDLSVHLWRAWTPLAPQDMSLAIRTDSDRGKVSVRLQNDGDDSRFIWQDWVDAAMGCMKGFEEYGNGEKGYGRKVVRAELRKAMVELCPLRVNGYGIEAVVERTNTARVWAGWPAFDVRICKFEVDQWLDAFDVDIRESWVLDRIIECFEGVMEAVVSAQDEVKDLKKSTPRGDV